MFEDMRLVTIHEFVQKRGATCTLHLKCLALYHYHIIKNI